MKLIAGKTYKVLLKDDYCSYGGNCAEMLEVENIFKPFTIAIQTTWVDKTRGESFTCDKGWSWAVKDFIWLDKAKEYPKWL